MQSAEVSKFRYFYKLLEITLNHLSYLKDNIFRHFFQEKITSFHFLEG